MRPSKISTVFQGAPVYEGPEALRWQFWVKIWEKLCKKMDENLGEIRPIESLLGSIEVLLKGSTGPRVWGAKFLKDLRK